MTNILLTNKCVRACPYCFAGKEMALTPTRDFMSWENIVYLADFLHLSRERRVSLIGGEPSLHPDFIDILFYFAERRFDVNAFTSGIMSQSKLDELERCFRDLSPHRLSFICNVNDPAQTETPAAELEKLERFLAIAAPNTMLGFNIYRPDFSLDFLFDLIDRHKLKDRLRLGIAHPIPGADNAFLSIDDIAAVFARLHSYRGEFERLRVKPCLDCGFPLCKVTDEQLGWIVRLGGQANFKCRPAIDITPDMEVYCCFPLAASGRRSLFEFDSLQKVVDHFMGDLRRIREQVPGIYAECATCAHRAEGHGTEGMCAGGAACQIVNRLGMEERE